MRHADAELQLWLANDRIAREQRDAELVRAVRAAGHAPTLRQRTGAAVIALGERLAGEHRNGTRKARLATRAF
jgi:hypothetical protein